MTRTLNFVKVQLTTIYWRVKIVGLLFFHIFSDIDFPAISHRIVSGKNALPRSVSQYVSYCFVSVSSLSKNYVRWSSKLLFHWMLITFLQIIWFILNEVKGGQYLVSLKKLFPAGLKQFTMSSSQSRTRCLMKVYRLLVFLLNKCIK